MGWKVPNCRESTIEVEQILVREEKKDYVSDVGNNVTKNLGGRVRIFLNPVISFLPTMPNDGWQSKGASQFLEGIGLRINQLRELVQGAWAEHRKVKFPAEEIPNEAKKVTIQEVVSRFAERVAKQTKRLTINTNSIEEISKFQPMVEEQPSKSGVTINASQEPG